MQVIGGVAYDPWEAFLWLQNVAVVRGYDKHFGPAELGPMPKAVKYICCSQMIISRDRLQARLKEFFDTQHVLRPQY